MKKIYAGFLVILKMNGPVRGTIALLNKPSEPLFFFKLLSLIFFLALIHSSVFSQDELLDMDEDALFNKTGGGNNNGDSGVHVLEETEKPLPFFVRPGFSLDAAYSAAIGFFPGFYQTPGHFDTPWEFDPKKDQFDTIVGASISATVGLTINPSETLRIRQSVTFAIPSANGSEMPLSFKEFYIDYNLFDTIYLKAGKFDMSWGISPNYPYVNLLARTPLNIKDPGVSYIACADIPAGIGGFQFVTIARSALMSDPSKPKIDELAYGAKFNLAIPFIDVDLGLYSQKKMPIYFFTSIKKTLFKTWETYAEATASYNFENAPGMVSFSYSGGFINDFFSGRLKVNAEVYYNGESSSYALTDNKIKPDEKEKTLLLPGLNTALNLSFKPGLIFNTTFLVSGLYSYKLHSGQIIPAVRFEPIKHLKFYFTFQTAIGETEGDVYYNVTPDRANRPFAMSIVAIINGIYNLNHFEN